MDHHLEVELKWALAGQQHADLGHQLTGLLGPPGLLAQDNRFFDSADRRLYRARLNVRLRRENDRLLLTCKRKAGEPDHLGVHQHDEWEQWLDPGLWERLDDRTVDLRTVLPLPDAIRTALMDVPLQSLGGFSNQRQEYRDNRLGRVDLLCLDRSVFAGGRIDHELEIETTRPIDAASHWTAVLAGWGIVPTPQPLTKFARFLSGLKA